MDKLSVDRIYLLHPQLRKSALDAYSDICLALKGRAMCRITFTLRTFKEQETLYNQGRTTNGTIVTNAKAGCSYHNYGLALDIALVLDTNKDGKLDTASWDTEGDYDGDLKSDWMECVQIFKSHGWDWGGDWSTFKDMPHFEKRFGYHWKVLLEKHNKKDFINGTNYVNI